MTVAANQNVPTGYKQTDIGVIPMDWDVKELGDLVEVRDGTHQTPKYVDNGIPFYSVESITNNDFVNTKYISESAHKLLTKKFRIEKMDILMTRIGSIGDCKLITWNPNASFYVSLALLKPRDKSTAPFIYHFSKTEVFKKELEDRSLQWAIPKKINLGEISKIKICVPILKAEQTAIATMLSDMDVLIEKLKKLIEKKKNIKKGAMQELLTGKKRVSGFNDGWEVKKLGQIAAVIGGGTPSTYNPNYWNGVINWFTPTEIGLNKYTYSSLRKISKEGLKNCSAKILPKGTVLLTSRAGIGDMSILMDEGCTNQGFQSLIANSDTSYEFLYYLVSTLKNILIQNASGSTFLEISPNKIKQIDVKIPNFKEQIAIANVLSDMDTEIEKLESQFVKYNNLKQGMMQNLLTGKIRLIKK
jgi:type I restriction enzyme S subunit